jgi:methylmalonyl-CoA/ethylmalonyl-CoA epimerase
MCAEMMAIDLFGKEAQFDHVGMSTKSIERALGDVQRTVDPIQKVTVAFFFLHGLPIAAVEPCGDNSPVATLTEKGIRLLHLCYRVPDIEEAIRTAQRNGLLLVARPAPAAAFGGRKIAWVFSDTMGLFELLESSPTGGPNKTVG